MKTYRILISVFVLLVLFAFAVGTGWADGGEEPRLPENPYTVDASVASTISYQGVLEENGVPVTGSRDMTFRLYSDSGCATQAGGDIVMPGVSLANGLFSVNLSVSQASFNGQALYLGLVLDAVRVSCQEVLPAPYALSLRPGATIEGTVDEMLVVDNTNTGGGDWDTLIVRNDSGGGEAIEVAAVNNGVASFATNGYGVYGSSTNSYGVWGQSNSTSSAGVFAKGYYSGADLILGGNSTSDDDGRIHSDPLYSSSDLLLVSNDAIIFYLDSDDSAEDADFVIYDKDGVDIFDLDESGDLSYAGALIGAFPRPAYDSGWVIFPVNEFTIITHNLGYPAEDYFVDMVCKDPVFYGVNNLYIGGDRNDSSDRGANWFDLDTNSIRIFRFQDDYTCEQARIRIWVIK